MLTRRIARILAAHRAMPRRNASLARKRCLATSRSDEEPINENDPHRRETSKQSSLRSILSKTPATTNPATNADPVVGILQRMEAATTKASAPRPLISRMESMGPPSNTKTQSLLHSIDRIMEERRQKKERPAVEMADSKIFQVLQPTVVERPENAWDAMACARYLEQLEIVLEEQSRDGVKKAKQKRFLEKNPHVVAWLRQETPAVPVHLPFLQSQTSGSGGKEKHETDYSTTVTELVTIDHEERKLHHQQVQQQRQRFLEHQNSLLRENRPSDDGIVLIDSAEWTSEHLQVAQTLLYRVCNLCARHMNGAAALVLWNKVQEMGIADRAFLHNLLYIASMNRRGNGGKFDELAGLAAFPGKESSDSSSIETVNQVASYHDLLYEPTHHSIQVRVQYWVGRGEPELAEALLLSHNDKDKLEDGTELRLRAFTPVLRLYLALDQFSHAIRLYRKMQAMPLVHLVADTYLYMIIGLAEKGCFRHRHVLDEAEPKEGGPQLLDEILSEMARDVIEVNPAAVVRLRNAWIDGFPGTSQGLSRGSGLTPLPLTRGDFEKEPPKLVADRVSIDPRKSGTCPVTGVNLRLIRLAVDQRDHLRSSILKMSRESALTHRETILRQQKHRNRNGKTSNDIDKSSAELEDFLHWLNVRTGEPFTVFVDGPNVAYYMQSFEGGRFNFHQLKFVVDELERIGERPLVILPQKYTRARFKMAGNRDGDGMQYATNSEKVVLRELVDSNKVHVVPPGALDDYYWILASVADQTVAREGQSLFVEPDNVEGRWAGTRPVLLSNDQMRDHKIGMLEPMLFRRWFSNHMVNYNFAPFVNDRAVSKDIHFYPADVFSREIQSNSMEDGRTVWHIPLGEGADDQDDEWFCLAVPNP